MGLFSSVKQVYNEVSDRIYERRAREVSEITENMRILRVMSDYSTAIKYVVQLKNDLEGLILVLGRQPEYPYLAMSAEQIASENPAFYGGGMDSAALDTVQPMIMAYACQLAGTNTLSPTQLLIRLAHNGKFYDFLNYCSDRINWLAARRHELEQSLSGKLKRI